MNDANEAMEIEVFDGLLKSLSNLYPSEKFEALRKSYVKEIPTLPAHEIIGAYKAALLDFQQESARPFVKNVVEIAFALPHPEIYNFINRGQVASKRWLIEELANTFGRELGTVFILGGWYGALSTLIFDSGNFDVKKVLSLDVDPNAVRVARAVNNNLLALGKFDSVIADMFRVNYASDFGLVPDLIINTCCEHIVEFDQWLALIPADKRLVLQSNNYFSEPDHVNCVNTLEEFEKQCNLSEVSFRGSLQTKKYTRFMLMGRK